MTTTRRRQDAWPLIVLFGGALLLRLLYLFELRATPLFDVLIGDAREYDRWARAIAAGQWLGSRVFYQSPLYPYLLAIVFRVAGHHLFLVRLLQAAGSAAACVLVAMAGTRLFDRRAGLAAGCLVAVYAPSLFFDGLIQKASLDLLLMAALLWGIAELSESGGRWSMAATAGVAAALLSVNRENARLLLPIVAVWLLTRRQPRAAIVFVAAAAAILLPIGVRNYSVGGEFFLSTSQAGPNFYIGNHRGASGLYTSLLPERGNAQFEREDATRLAQQATGRTLSPGEVSSYWFHRAFDDLRQDRPAWLRLTGRKLLLAVNAAEAPDTESLAAYAHSSITLWIVRWLDFGVLLPVAIAGLWLERARWRRLWVLHAAALALLSSMAAFFVFARYRFPAVPILALFAGVTLSRMRLLSRSTRAQWAPALAMAAAAALICRLPIDAGADETSLNLGRQLIADGRPDAAVPLLQESAAVHPQDAADAFTLGVAYDRTGNKPAALEQFRRAVAIEPGDGRAQGSLALALIEAGHASDAFAHFAAAVTAAPEDGALRLDYGLALARNQRSGEAVTQLREAARLSPEDARPHAALGLALAQGGREADGIRELERSVQLKDDVETRYGLAELYVRAGRRADAIDTLHHALALARATGRQDAIAAIQSVLAQLGG